jgi:hypothetical protein
MSQNLLEYFWNHERKNTEDRLRTNVSAIKMMFALLLRSMRDSSEWVANYSNITGENTQKVDNAGYAKIMERMKTLAESYDLAAQDLNKMLGNNEDKSARVCDCKRAHVGNRVHDTELRTNELLNPNDFQNKEIGDDVKTDHNVSELPCRNIMAELSSYEDEVSATSISDELYSKDGIYDDVYDRNLLEMHRHMDQRREEYYKQQKKESDNTKKKSTTITSSVKSVLDDNFDVQSILRKMPINELNAVLEEFYYRSLAKAKESFGTSEVDKQELENLAAKYADELLIEYCMKKK